VDDDSKFYIFLVTLVLLLVVWGILGTVCDSDSELTIVDATNSTRQPYTTCLDGESFSVDCNGNLRQIATFDERHGTIPKKCKQKEQGE